MVMLGGYCNVNMPQCLNDVSASSAALLLVALSKSLSDDKLGLLRLLLIFNLQ